MIGIIDLHIYPRRVRVAIEEDFNEINRDLYSNCLDLSNINDYKAITFTNLFNTISNKHEELIIIPKVEDVDYGVISHESGHVTFNVLEKIGFKLDYDNTEPYAYLLGYIVKELTKIIEQYKNDKGRDK